MKQNHSFKVAIITSLTGGLGHYSAHLAGPLSQHCSLKFITYPQSDPSGTIVKQISDTFVKQHIKWPRFDIDESNPQSIVTIDEYLKKRDIELINIHIATTVKRKITYFTTFIQYCKKISERKFVFTLHDVLPFDEDKELKKLLKMFYSLGDSFTVGNETEKEKLMIHFNIPESKITIIPHGIYNLFDRNLFTKELARSYLGIPQEKKVLLFFGFLRDYKGFEYLVKAIKILTKTHNDFMVYVASGLKYASKGLLEKNLELIEKLGIQEYFGLNLNYLETFDVEAVFKASDIVVLPYTSASQSGVLMMALGFKKPVIITETFYDKTWIANKFGLVAKNADSQSLAEKIETLLNDREKSIKFGEEGYKYAIDNFGWDKIAEKYFHVFKKTMNS